MPIGLITKLIGGRYTVMNLDTQEEVLLQARGKLRNVTLTKDSCFQKQKGKKDTIQVKLSPKVGDYVSYDDSFILEILPRKNEMIRPDCANVDQILLVFATKKPDFNYLLLDKFLCLIESAGITPVIVITKIDLCTEEEIKSLKENLSYYEELGYQILYTNVKKGIGVEDVSRALDHKITVVAGQTGAGKSSLINSLIPGLTLNTDEISLALGRGKHTTRHTEIFRYQNKWIADTPGFSSLDFSDMDPLELKDYFKEFHRMSQNCKFHGCSHIHEPKCFVKEAYEKGEILKSRYENYVKIYNELKEQKEKRY